MKIKRKRVDDEHPIDDYTLSLIKVLPEHTDNMISRQQNRYARPEGKAPKGKLWCVYCNGYHFFKVRNEINKDTNYNRCMSCGMSDNDFHIKNANGLWGNYK